MHVRTTIAAALGTMLALAARHEPPTTAGTRSGSPETAASTAWHRGAIRHVREEARRAAYGSIVIDNGAYRATFAAHGVAFTPAGDAGLDRRLTWRYRAAALETATTARALAPAVPAVSAAGDHIVEFHRPGLVERYVGERTGIEQVFVLTERPHGRGDVRVRGSVTFDGDARPATDGGLAYDAGADATPELTYAAPVAFDAAGRSLPVRAEAADGRLDLVLDGAAIEDARFPVTIDPLLGVATAYNSATAIFPDVAYNADRAEFLVVFSARSVPDEERYDVRGRRYRHDGDPIAPSFLISPGGLVDVLPRVAYDLHGNHYLVVWVATNLEFDVGRIVGRRLSSAGAPLAGEIAISQADVVAAAPDVTARNLHDHPVTATSFVVVWPEGDDASGYVLKRARLDANGVTIGLGELSENNALQRDSHPRITYDPAADRFFAVWVEEDLVRGRAMSAAGTHAPETVVSTLAGKHPSVAFDPGSRQYLVAWHQDGEAADGVFAQFLSSAGTPALRGANFRLNTLAASGISSYPDVAADAGTFVVAYQDDVVDHTRYARVNGNGSVVTDSRLDTGVVFAGPAAAASAHGDLFTSQAHLEPALPSVAWVLNVTHGGRWTSHYVHGPTGDFDRDGRADLFVYQPWAGRFQVRTQGRTEVVPVGAAGDTPALLEWDGDEFVDLATYRPSTGTWRIALTATGAQAIETLGTGGGDIPVPGDYLGDGRTEIAVFSPTTRRWIIRENGSVNVTTVQFGAVGDVPVPADYDGDGKTELAVWRPFSGTWYTSELNGTGQTQVRFGQVGDTPLQGNFIGSPHADQVVFRPQERRWYRRDGAKGTSTSVLQNVAGVPMPLDYDGDGLLDLVLFDWKLGRWTIRQGATDTFVTFGALLDIPAGSS